MAKPKNDKRKDYARYAAHCLDMVTTTKDQEARCINREMAAEWLKLADAILHPLKPVKYPR
jgi:DNA primase